MSLFSRKKGGECKLVFDIGSGSVGGAIVRASEERSPTILYSLRSEIPFQEEATGTRLLSLMLRSLAQVTLALSSEGFDAAGFGARRPKIGEVLISLSAPWTISKTLFLSLQNREPVTMTKEVFSALLRHSDEEMRASKSGIPKGSVQIERQLVTSILNGYETFSPYEKSAREAEFALFMSFTPAKVREGVTDTITSLVHPRVLRFHSFAFLLFAALRGLSPHERHFIAMDVSGEQTEILYVEGGVPIRTTTFPLGRNRLIRALKKGVGVPPGGAASLIGLHVDQSGSGKMLEQVKKVLALAETEWSSECLRALQDFSAEAFLPKVFFIAADDDVMPIFTHALEHADVSRFPIAPRSFGVVPVRPEFLSPLVTWNASSAPDPFIGLVSSFARSSST